MAWLSSFPERSLQFEVLDRRFWIYSGLSAFSGICGIVMVFRFLSVNANQDLNDEELVIPMIKPRLSIIVANHGHLTHRVKNRETWMKLASTI